MSRVLALTAGLCAGLLFASLSAADPGRNARALPATPEAWLSQMLDAKKNGAAFKDPAAFAEWLDAITEPRFMTALAAVAVDPATYPKVLADAVDPQAARNWAEFTDPQLYLRWVFASSSPAFQQAIVRKLTDPGKTARWIDALSRPDAYAALSAGFARAPGAWMNAAMSPASYAPMLGAAQPATPVAWFGALAEGIAKQDWRTLPAEKLTGVRYRY